MNINNIETDFKKKVSDKIKLMPEGRDRFKIFTPFMFDDGDHLVSVLKKTPNGWVITDEAHTFMHLSYDMEMKDLERGMRQKIVDGALSVFGLQDNSGEILIKVDDELYGDALYSFVQGIIKITDVNYLNRERVKSTFYEDFRSYVSQKISEQRRAFEYFDLKHDPNGHYKVDCKISGLKKPLFLFAINSDAKCQESTINCLTYEKWGIPFRPIAIFEEQEEINRKVLARFSDVCDKQFSSLSLNKDRIYNYLTEEMAA